MLSYLFNLDTELSAVNSILGSIGQAPITSLQFENPEIGLIYNIFQDTLIDIQSEGWSFNSFENIELEPDENGVIGVPANFIHVDVVDNDVDKTTNIVVLGKVLVDKNNLEQITFEKPVKVNAILALDYTDLPVPFKRYVAARSAARAATQLVTNKELVAMLASQESYLRATCMEYECNQGDFSYFGTPEGSTYNSFKPYHALNRL